MQVNSCLTLFLASRFKNSDDTECSRMGTLPGKRLILNVEIPFEQI
jgi:hypothetical protein